MRGALPGILTGLRMGIGFGWTTLAAGAGLGHMVPSAAAPTNR